MNPSSKPRVNPWIVLAVVCLGQFMVVLDATVVNVALPTVQKDLGFSVSSLQWVINAYTLVFGGFLLLGGRAADLFGRRRLFLAGVVVFTAASVIDGLAPNAGVLIVARGLQGLGGALVSPAALSILTTSFADGKPRAKAMGVWAAIAVGGGAMGLIFGGILTEYADWRWVFFVNLPVGLITLALGIRLVPESKGEGAQGFDLVGAFTVTAGLVLLVYGIVKAQSAGWISGTTFGLVGLSVVLLVAFVVWEQRTASPLLRLGIFRTRSLTAANLTMLVVAGGMFSVFYFATLYVQQVLGLSPVQAGCGFLPLTAAIILSSGASQGLIGRVGVRTIAIIGMTVGAIGLLLLSRVSVGGSYVTDVLPGITVMGLGLGGVFVPMTLIGTTNVDADDAGLASGLFNTSQQVGGALGLAILSTIAANAATGSGPLVATVAGYRAGFAAAAALMVAGLVMTVVLIRNADVAAINTVASTPAVEPA